MSLDTLLQITHVVAGLIVLAEALNKLERAAPLAGGLTPRQRVVDGLKALAWALLALGAGGALAGPLLQPMGAVQAGAVHFVRHITQPAPSLADVCVLAGFAVLIVRTRIKEG
jgi:hypothetical protein